MLKNSFYLPAQIITTSSADQPVILTTTLRLIPAHPVYDGHFPGNPVVPGVCQIQMIREIMEEWTGLSLKLTTADTIKFTSLINPLNTPIISFSLTIKDLPDQQWSVNATIHSPEVTFMKFRGIFGI